MVGSCFSLSYHGKDIHLLEGLIIFSSTGTSFSRYVPPQILVSATSDPDWTSVVKAENDTHYIQHPSLHIRSGQYPSTASFSIDYKGGKQLHFLQGSDSSSAFSNRKIIETPGHTPLNAIAASESSGIKVFAEGLPRVFNSDCALSLLSAPTQASSSSLSRMVVPANQIPMAQPLVTSMQYSSMGQYSCSQVSNSVSSTGFSCSEIDNDQVGTVLVSDGNCTDLQCHGIFQVPGDGSSENGASQTFPFSW